MVPRIKVSSRGITSCHHLKLVSASVSSLYDCATMNADPARYGRAFAALARARITANLSGESSVYPSGPVPLVKETTCGRYYKKYCTQGQNGTHNGRRDAKVKSMSTLVIIGFRHTVDAFVMSCGKRDVLSRCIEISSVSDLSSSDIATR